MEKRTLLKSGVARMVAAAIVAGILLIGITSYFVTKRADVPADQAARQTVIAFGTQMRMVSVLAPADSVAAAMDQYYAPYVSADLIAEWKTRGAAAPGRVTSSPYPARIDVTSVSMLADDSYAVEGTLVDATEAEGKVLATRSVNAVVRKEADGEWRIVSLEIAPYGR
jgi:hypothetical protein